MTVAVFTYADWIARYPEFSATVNSSLAGLYFGEATLYLNNTDCSIVPADAVTYQPRLTILYALTAHVAALNAGSSGQPASPLVGRVSDASEGSVSVSTDLSGLNTSQQAAFFTQTKYGLSAWQMMAVYRTARYQASPGRFAQIPGNLPYGMYSPWNVR